MTHSKLNKIIENYLIQNENKVKINSREILNGDVFIALPNNEFFDLVVFDIRGSVVFSKERVTHSISVSGGAFTSGAYILRLTHSKGVINKKIFVK